MEIYYSKKVNFISVKLGDRFSFFKTSFILAKRRSPNLTDIKFTFLAKIVQNLTVVTLQFKVLYCPCECTLTYTQSLVKLTGLNFFIQPLKIKFNTFILNLKLKEINTGHLNFNEKKPYKVLI